MNAGAITVLSVLLVFALVLPWRRRHDLTDSDVDYFLARRQISWLTTALGGAVSSFDVAAVPLVIAGCALFGVGSLWLAGGWGLLLGAVLAAYGARCLRRSGALTAAEWVNGRFGRTMDATLARTAAAIVNLAATTGILALATWTTGHAIGLFAPVTSSTGSMMAVAAAVVWSLPRGARGLAESNVFASVVLHLVFAGIAAFALLDVDYVAVAMNVAADWLSLFPDLVQSRAYTPAELEPFGLAALALFGLGLLAGAGGPLLPSQSQRLLSTTLIRDAPLAGAGWAVLVAVRWAAYMAIAATLAAAAAPVGGAGALDAFQRFVEGPIGPIGQAIVLPAVALAGIAAAASALHTGAALVTEDIFRSWTGGRQLSPRLLRFAAFAGGIAVALAGISLTASLANIRLLVHWLVLLLLGGCIVPNTLRWFWWRYNAWGYLSGMLFALIAATALCAVDFALPLYLRAILICLVSIPVNLLPTLVAEPPTMARLKHFYTTVHPAGWWRPVLLEVLQEEPEFARRTRTRHDVLNALLFSVCCTLLYGAAGLLMVQRIGEALVAFGLCLIVACALYLTWYRSLPPD